MIDEIKYEKDTKLIFVKLYPKKFLLYISYETRFFQNISPKSKKTPDLPQVNDRLYHIMLYPLIK
jgi:hypothetical protein